MAILIYFQNTQMNSAPAATAKSVKGRPTFMKSENPMSYPCFYSNPTPTIFADAPIGVMLPPTVVPIMVPNMSR